MHVCVCACVCVYERERDFFSFSVGRCFILLHQHVSEWLIGIVLCGKEKKWEGMGTYFSFRVKRK